MQGSSFYLLYVLVKFKNGVERQKVTTTWWTWLANDGAFWSDRPSAFAPSLFCVVDYSLSFGTWSLEYTGLQLHCCSAATTACCWRTTTGKGGEELSCSAVQPWCTPHQLRCTAHLIWWSIADVAFHRLHQDSHGLHRIPNFDKAIGQSASIHGTDHWWVRLV
jgi:hypothetical protein